MTKIKHTASFTIAQSAETLFPLFSAEGEKLWVPDWDYENIMGSKELHEDDVFVTQTHDHASTAAIWLVKRYEPESFLVQFYKVEPEDKVGIVTVQCQPLTQRETQVEVSYAYIALSDTGREFIERFTATEYEAFMAEWQTLLNQYFASR